MKTHFASLILSIPVMAMATPNAGNILQQVQPAIAPVNNPVEAELVIEKAPPTVLPESRPFFIGKINLIGNEDVSLEILHPLIAEAEGKNLTLAQLETIIMRITNHYMALGMPLARAIVPAQRVVDGNITVQIILAKYGAINVVNRSRASDKLLADTLAPLQTGDNIESPALNRVLLLASDLPGVVSSATLSPGQRVGSSDLTVVVESGPRVSGRLLADNFGGKATGEVRLGGTVTILNPFGRVHSDQITASLLSSGTNMTYGRVGYESVVTGSGTRVGASTSALNYTLGGAFQSSNSTGTASVFSLFVKQPVLRSVDANVSVQAQAVSLKLSDKRGVEHTNRNVHEMGFSVIVDGADKKMGGGRNSALLGIAAGQVEFTNDKAKTDDSASAKTAGHFVKLNASLARVQAINHSSELLLTVSGQAANKNLDSSSKMTLGGVNSVRGYEPGVVSGDSGYALTIEYRKNLALLAKVRTTGLVFFDTGTVTIHKNPLGTSGHTGHNQMSLSSAGLGMNWSSPSGWSAQTFAAVPLGKINPALNAKKSVRIWLQASSSF